MKRVAIVEPAHGHEEVILPQVELLRGTFDVHVVAPQSLLDVDLLRDTAHLYHGHPFTASPPRTGLRRLLGIPARYLAIFREVDRIRPDVVVFNSTYTVLEIALIHVLFRKYPRVQIIHDFRKCLGPIGRRLYRAFNGNLVISERVHAYVTATHPEFADLGYFLPIFFGGFAAPAVASPPAPAAPLKLGVFGTIEEHRRNYRGLLDAVRNLARTSTPVGFQVYLVGRAPPGLRNEIVQDRLQDIITCYAEFVPFRRMFELLGEMDIVLFLIDGAVADSQQYNRYKISGTSTLAKAFPKAVASSTDFPLDDSLVPMAFTYPCTAIGDLLTRIADGRITAAEARAKAQFHTQQPLFTFREQEKQLVGFLTRAMHGWSDTRRPPVEPRVTQP